MFRETGNTLAAPYRLLITIKIKRVFLVAKVENLLVPAVCSWLAWEKNTDRR